MTKKLHRLDGKLRISQDDNETTSGSSMKRYSIYNENSQYAGEEIKVQKFINNISVKQRTDMYSPKYFSENLEKNYNFKSLTLKSKEIKTSLPLMENFLSEHVQKSMHCQHVESRLLERIEPTSTYLHQKPRKTSRIMKPSFHSIPEEKEIAHLSNSPTKQVQFLTPS